MHVTALKALTAITGLLALAGCATIPAPLAGDFPDFLPEQATERSIGGNVRWGGVIVDAEPLADRTCVEVLSHQLDRNKRPVRSDRSYGRFLACRSGFLDPVVFSRGRDITVIGRIEDLVEGEIGEYRYRYPRLDAEVIYLWPEVVERYYHDPWPWYGPWYYHPFHHPYHLPYRTRVSGTIIIRR